jgi:hypothetical protein
VKVRIDDPSALSALRPLDIVAYLHSRGWTETDPQPDEPLAMWETTINGSTFELLVPCRAHWRDYGRRVASVLDTLGEAEQRSQLAIMHDITSVFVDVVRLRVTNGSPSDETIGLLDGLDVGAAGRGLMLSAACSTLDPKKAYPPRKPAAAMKFLDGLRMGQSERGSYVFTVLSPVAPALQLSLPYREAEPAAADPFERRVSRTLGVALERLHHAATRGAATGAIEAFEQAVPFGVNADLCEAIGLLRESALSSFAVNIAWASSRPVPAKTPSGKVFTKDVLEVVHEAGRVLRERTPIEDFELVGPVIDVSRPDATLHGMAVVLGRVNDQPRQVTVEVWGEDWHTATDAMKNHQVLRCVGELSVRGTYCTLKSARNLSIEPRPPG